MTRSKRAVESLCRLNEWEYVTREFGFLPDGSMLIINNPQPGFHHHYWFTDGKISGHVKNEKTKGRTKTEKTPRDILDEAIQVINSEREEPQRETDGVLSGKRV